MFVSLLWIGLGLVGLVIGGECLVRGASRLAGLAGISPLVVGLTVVAFGTSAPEFAVTLGAAWDGRADLAVGGVIGSNIFNILAILGLAALVAPLVVKSQLVRRDVPVMIAASLALGLVGWDGRIDRWEGLGLFAALLVYLAWTFRQSRFESAAVQQEFAQEFAPTGARRSLAAWGKPVVAMLVGLVVLTIGARCMVDGAVLLAREFGLSELLIGLTIVAAGTSLPELSTSILASLRGERDIAVGNVVGSNIFNILGVLGLAAAILPDGVPFAETAWTIDLPFMIAVAVACLPICFTGHRIDRWEGGVFLGYYLAYTIFLVLMASAPELGRGFAVVLLGFVLPLTVLTLAVSLLRALRQPPRPLKD